MYDRLDKALYPRIAKLLSNTGRDPSLASRIGGLVAAYDPGRAAALSRASKATLAVAVGEYLHLLGMGDVPLGFKLPERPRAKTEKGVTVSPPMQDLAAVLPSEAPGAMAGSVGDNSKINVSKVMHCPDKAFEVPTAMSPPSGAGIASGDGKPAVEVAAIASESVLKMEGGCPPATGNNASPRALEMEGASPSSTVENTSPCALEQESGAEQPHNGQAEQGGALVQEMAETPTRATAGCGGEDTITNVSDALVILNNKPSKDAIPVSAASGAGRLSTGSESVAVLDDRALMEGIPVASSSTKSVKKASISGTSSVGREIKHDSSSSRSTTTAPASALEQGARKGRKPRRQAEQGTTLVGPAREELAVKLPHKPEATNTKGRHRKRAHNNNNNHNPAGTAISVTGTTQEPTTVSTGSGLGLASAGSKSVQVSEGRRPSEGLPVAPPRKTSFLAALLSGPEGVTTSGGMAPQVRRKSRPRAPAPPSRRLTRWSLSGGPPSRGAWARSAARRPALRGSRRPPRARAASPSSTICPTRWPSRRCLRS
jgi:hypothetical protein